MFWSAFGGWNLEKQPLKFNWASGNVNLRVFFNTRKNHFKVQEWRTRWNWKHRTIFHSFLQLSLLFFTSFKFNSLCEEIQLTEFGSTMYLKSFIPLCLRNSLCYRVFCFGYLHSVLSWGCLGYIYNKRNHFKI